MHVAILGLGPSVRQFLELTKRMGGRRAFCDQVWTINALGDVFASDLIFHMDDVRIQQVRADAAPQSNIANMLAWLRTSPVPVITSRAHPEYPALREFPLAEVVTAHPIGYFNSTAAYAIAYALHVGATKISLFGMDFTYENAHDAEKGRACVEWWLGVAASRGVQLGMPKTTSLMDACEPRRFYGYDTVELKFAQQNAGDPITLEMLEREQLPTAADIERAYDHSRHPNPLMEAPERQAFEGAPEHG